MVPITGTFAGLFRVWSRGWYVGYRVHHGRAERWLAAVSGWFWDRLAVLNSESAGASYRRSVGKLSEESKVQWPQISWYIEAWNPREEVYEQPFQESIEPDEWPPQNESCREDDRRASSLASLVWWYQKSWGWHPSFEHDCHAIETYLLEPISHHKLWSKVSHESITILKLISSIEFSKIKWFGKPFEGKNDRHPKIISPELCLKQLQDAYDKWSKFQSHQ